MISKAIISRASAPFFSWGAAKTEALCPDVPEALYRAQTAAHRVFETGYFPCYSAKTLSEGGVLLRAYGFFYDFIEILESGLGRVIADAHVVGVGVLRGGDAAFGWAVRPLLDLVYGMNPISGHRFFVGMPRRFEKGLGDSIFYPWDTWGIQKSDGRIAEKVAEVFHRLLDANASLLNPKGEVPFDYRVTTIASETMNAFCDPGGGMVVYSELVKKLEEAISKQTIRNSVVTFADGSTATVDLKGVTVKDALAGLMGHEMTHAASRHHVTTWALLFFSMGCDLIVLFFGKTLWRYTLFLSVGLYLWGKNVGRHCGGVFDVLRLMRVFIIDPLLILWVCKKQETEADVTGAYFANKAQFNPLGALYVREFFYQIEKSRNKSSFTLWNWERYLSERFEFMRTHPFSEHRKRATFAAIREFAPQALRGRVKWTRVEGVYDQARSGFGMRYPLSILKPKP